MDILIICGHGQGDPGAIGIKQESILTRELGNIVKDVAIENGINATLYDTTKDCYRESILGRVPVYNNYDLVLEVHFNAFNSLANGTEILLHDGVSSNTAQCILNKMKDLGFYNRGIKIRNDILNINNCYNRGVANIYLETCFIDNVDDMNLYDSNKDNIANAIIEGICSSYDLNNVQTTHNESALSQYEEPPTQILNQYEEYGQAKVIVDTLNVRDNPSTNSNVVAQYNYGESFSYNYVIINNEGVWVRYTSYSGAIRYVCVKQEERYAECY